MTRIVNEDTSDGSLVTLKFEVSNEMFGVGGLSRSEIVKGVRRIVEQVGGEVRKVRLIAGVIYLTIEDKNVSEVRFSVENSSLFKNWLE